jgi:hypothetical protein
MEISCAVLTDNTRVISQRGLNNALKRPQGGAGVGKMPVFLRAAALKDFISDDLRREILNPIEYIPLHGGRSAYGVKADLLDDICQAWIDASNAGKLTEKQEETAEKARALKRAVGKIGWIALVDEATGFQKFRDEKALESLLSLYISKEFLPWMKTFIEAFYEEIYRLKGWHYDPRKNKYQVVGRYTLKYVYGCLPKKVVDEVKNKTPRDKSGNYTKKLFQSLTNEVGKPHLDRALGGVIALLKAAPSWSAFERSYERVYGNQKDQLTLPIALEE